MKAFPSLSHSLLSSVFGSVFSIALTPGDLQAHYREKKLKILLVPGHDNESPGGFYRKEKEADLNLKVSRNLFDILSADAHFYVITARNFSDGEYTDEFLTYFTRQGAEILSFRDRLKTAMRELLTAGAIEERDSVTQVQAGNNTSYKLYAINRWANDNGIDLVLHLHFNDYPGRSPGIAGEYSGFALYIPEKQYPNAGTSRALAESLFSHLSGHFPVSTLPLEKDGIIEDQDLIAVGSNASRIGASLLIEYGYIYEPHIANTNIRDAVFLELAYQTYRGIKKYFSSGDISLPTTTYLPYLWNAPLAEGERGNRDVLSLQQALAEEGLYPPPGTSFISCPINGNFGPCVEKAVTLFQEKYKDEILAPLGLLRGTGAMGEKTQAKLNALHGR